MEICPAVPFGHSRSEVGWKNEHAVGVVSAKVQNAGAARAAAKLCKAGGGRNANKQFPNPLRAELTSYSLFHVFPSFF